MLDHLKANNRAWAARMISRDAGFFNRLERQQAPEYLWIGCSDSRVPATQIVDVDPGHIIVVGHYGCGGVSAAVDGKRRGLVDHWLHPIREVLREHRHELDAIVDPGARLDRLCELNVIRQVRNVASDIIVQEAWAHAQDLTVHGWIYSLANGLVTDLGVTVSAPTEIERRG